MIRVLIFNEYYHERVEESARSVYPEGIHKVLADFLADDDIQIKCTTLEDDECKITKEMLDETDVLIWWGHVRHKLVPDEVAALVRDAVLSGMGAIFLHSGHHSKPFKTLMGTSANLCWRESGDSELVWVVEPSHPITRGINRYFKLDAEETYGEPFVIPTPDKLLLLANFSGGEVFRAGCLFERGNGKIFYFQPGHETFPTYYNPDVQTVIKNAVRYLAPTYREVTACHHVRNVGEEGGYVIK